MYRQMNVIARVSLLTRCRLDGALEWPGNDLLVELSFIFSDWLDNVFRKFKNVFLEVMRRDGLKFNQLASVERRLSR